MNDAALRRGLVLLHVHAQYPGYLAEKTIEFALAAFYRASEDGEGGLRRDLGYLVERELLDEKVERIGSSRVRTFKLTADGVLVVEKRKQDPGVEFG